jgi:membrane associated rhomboid family serine protease
VKSSEPIFNIPPVMVALIGAMVLVHFGRYFLLSPDADLEFLLRFAFIPARYTAIFSAGPEYPGGVAADVWTFVTYALIHGDITHLATNMIWLLPFGSAVARRFGRARFMLMFVATAVAGALAHLVTHAGEAFPMIGASGAVSGFMAAAVRFVFERGGPIDAWRRPDPANYRLPAAPLSVALRNPRVVIFLLIWFALNTVFGLGASIVPGAEQEIAWQAHIGGFLAGMVLFPIFDPVSALQHDRDVDADSDDR